MDRVAHGNGGSKPVFGQAFLLGIGRGGSGSLAGRIQGGVDFANGLQFSAG
jgi:hypothetical protein